MLRDSQESPAVLGTVFVNRSDDGWEAIWDILASCISMVPALHLVSSLPWTPVTSGTAGKLAMLLQLMRLTAEGAPARRRDHPHRPWCIKTSDCAGCMLSTGPLSSSSAFDLGQRCTARCDLRRLLYNMKCVALRPMLMRLVWSPLHFSYWILSVSVLLKHQSALSIQLAIISILAKIPAYHFLIPELPFYTLVVISLPDRGFSAKEYLMFFIAPKTGRLSQTALAGNRATADCVQTYHRHCHLPLRNPRSAWA